MHASGFSAARCYVRSDVTDLEENLILSENTRRKDDK